MKARLDPPKDRSRGVKPDPSGRHELRYWNGRIWTDHVFTPGGEESSDPVGTTRWYLRWMNPAPLRILIPAGVVLAVLYVMSQYTH